MPSHVKIGASGIFQFRFVVPEPLRAIVGKRELKYSLGKDYRQMQEQAWHLNVCVKLLQQCLRGAMSEMTDEERKEQLKLAILSRLLSLPDYNNASGSIGMEFMTALGAKNLTMGVQSTIATLLREARPTDLRSAGLTPEYLQRVIQELSQKSKPGLTLEKLLDKWIEAKKQSNKSDKSMNAYNTTKAELIWAFGARKEAANITSDDIREYKTFGAATCRC